MSNEIYTVGHSNNTIDHFLELLKKHNINCLVDVRSNPYSKYVPHFNQEPLKNKLAKENILYMHFGKEFGARIIDKKLLDKDGQVDFEKVQSSELFLAGVTRLKDGLAKGYTIALMCAEADPLDCHRFAMISSYLDKAGFIILHILKNFEIENNNSVKDRLLQKYKHKITESDLFNQNVDKNYQLIEAYKLINKDIGYRENTEVEEKTWE